MKSNLKSLLVWLVVAYGICLIPSSAFDWVKALLPSGSEGHSTGHTVDLLEWTAHAILMGGVAFSFFRLFRTSIGWFLSLLLSMFLVFLIAVSIEWLQGLLPPEFHRGPSNSDVWASLVGALIGGGLACVVRKEMAGAK